MQQSRINKYLSAKGVCSRREADRLLEAGRVLVNGRVAELGQLVSDKDTILIDGEMIKREVEKIVIAFNKPVGVTVSEKDEHAETLITDIIDFPVRLTYAGRLDKDSEGLILLTNDGDLINALMKGINGHQKEYIVSLDKEPSDRDIERLSKGIYIKELDRKTKPCVIRRHGKSSVSMILTEGLNRQIRRMWKIIGFKVVKLKRIRVANIKLDNLETGSWRKIEGEELSELYKIAQI